MLGMIISYLLFCPMTYEETKKQWFKHNWNYFVIGILLIFFLIFIFPENRREYETQGITKYLNKEIVIDELTITYDSQNQPIDTTYSYVRAGNNN